MIARHFLEHKIGRAEFAHSVHPDEVANDHSFIYIYTILFSSHATAWMKHLHFADIFSSAFFGALTLLYSERVKLYCTQNGQNSIEFRLSAKGLNITECV